MIKKSISHFLTLMLFGLLIGCAANKPLEIERPVSAERDEAGRQLHDAPHAMDPKMLDELRQSVPKFSQLNNGKIMQFMHVMGPNYTWDLVSDVAGDEDGNGYGVLLLVHGFREHGDRVFRERLQPLANSKPTSLALGMSMMTSDHIQLGLNNLVEAGAHDIIVIPVVSTRHNTMLRQWEYIFSRQATAEYATVPQVATHARVHFLQPLEDHPLVGETLVEYAAEISSNPAREEVIIVAHGPVFEPDNQKQLAMLQRLADYVAERSKYVGVGAVTLQDDATLEIRKANVEALRKRVIDAGARGNEVLIITNLLGTRIVQSQLRKDLRGLQYRFNSKGLIQHDNFIRWIELSVNETIATSR